MNNKTDISGPVSGIPTERDINAWSDRYFRKTKAVVEAFGDHEVTYAVFMRRPVVFAPRLMVEWLDAAATERKTEFRIDLNHAEGQWVGAGEPLLYISGMFSQLVDLETLYLQRLGAPCVAAYNAFTMCVELPEIEFLAMDARHCAGREMANMMAYAASVGSKAAQTQVGAKGFIGNATNATAHYFGNAKGMGTMPHALIGYAGSTLRAAEMFHETFPDENLTVLVDYYGQEVSDTLAVNYKYVEVIFQFFNCGDADRCLAEGKQSRYVRKAHFRSDGDSFRHLTFCQVIYHHGSK